MIRRLIEASLRLRVLVIAAATVVMVVGIGRMRRMPVDVLPEFAPPYIEIQTEALDKLRARLARRGFDRDALL